MNYKVGAPVAAMISYSGLPERSLMRRFAKATGMSPLDYIHALRLEEAKQLLESSDLAVEAIANEVGYEDTSFFGRLFRRKAGITPLQYRQRFGSLRQVLVSN
jgi:transcriptional regulator GlxA family with amidase domain